MRECFRMLMLSLLCLCLSAAPSLAEDVCTVEDAFAVSRITTDASYLRVLCPLEEASAVTLTVRDEWGTLIYQRNYGTCSGSFRSGDIHLPLQGSGCEYTVTLTTQGAAHTFTVVRQMPRLTDSAVYAGGATLRQMTEGSADKFAVVLDLQTLNEETLIMPMLADGVQLGEVYFSVLDGSLTVTARLTADGQIDKANVYIATDALTAETLGTRRFCGTKTRLERTVDLGDVPYAAVMVQMTVTYDPATAQAYAMSAAEEDTIAEILANWQLMQLVTANEAVG